MKHITFALRAKGTIIQRHERLTSEYLGKTI